MHIVSALRRKRDEIAATIAAYEARIEAARMDPGALEQAARLFDPEAGRDKAAIHQEFGRLTKLQETPAEECVVWELEQPLALGRSALPVNRARKSDDQEARPVESIGIREAQFTGAGAYSATQPAGGQIPDEFFYLNWP
jgi:hypothetical protein